jgi:uncharacterized RDD family membrane protein YckC
MVIDNLYFKDKQSSLRPTLTFSSSLLLNFPLINIYIYAYMYIYIYIYIYICIYTPIPLLTNQVVIAGVVYFTRQMLRPRASSPGRYMCIIWICKIHVYILTYVSMYKRTYIYLYINIYSYICICVYTIYVLNTDIMLSQ